MSPQISDSGQPGGDENIPLHVNSLPLQGSHLIEASAGTGKTYNIVRIYLRLLLEKEYSVEQILVMTFTVAATAELRNRLDRFLREALRTWDSPDDPCIQEIKSQQLIDNNRAKLLLRQAILQLDESAIYTIHGFCKRALGQQAFFSGMSFQTVLEADSGALALAATRDWYRCIQSRSDYQVIEDKWPTPEAFYQSFKGEINSDQPLHRPAAIDLFAVTKQFSELWPREREIFLKLNNITSRTARDTEVAITGLLAKLDELQASVNVFCTPPETRQLQYSEQANQRVAATVQQQASPHEAQWIPGFTKAELKKCFSTDKKKQQMPAAFSLVTRGIKHAEVTLVHYAIAGLEVIREQVAAAKLQREQMDFSDLICKLWQALDGPNGIVLAKALFKQFPAALVDEFQDTDPTQYDILRKIYACADHNHHYMLCMIGDPKQAIYGFRGGDVFAYLKARQNADYCWTMNTNYRSTAAVVNGYNQLFLQGEAEINQQVFGFGIDYHRVRANPDKPAIVFSDDRAAVQWVEFTADSRADGRETSVGLTESFKTRIADWVAAEIVTLLTDTTRNGKAILPADIAVIVRTGKEAFSVQSAFEKVGLASVYLSSRDNIFETNEAEDLLQLLRGIWQVEDDRLFTAALASLWIGLDYHALEKIIGDEQLWSEWQQKFTQWRDNWQSLGLMSVLLDCLKNHCQFADTLNRDRLLTNCIHLAERLQMVSHQYRTPDALLHWYALTLEDSSAAEENLLRLESDEALIKIITMHGSKGLEFPIVFLPFISYQSQPRSKPLTVSYHDRESFNVKRVFLPDQQQIKLAEEEDKAERKRLLYVAATRAEQRLYCCVAPFKQFNGSAISETLNMPGYERTGIAEKISADEDARLISIVETAIATKTFTDRGADVKINPANFTGRIERDWWLSSFSALTRHVSHGYRMAKDRDSGEEVSSAITQQLPLRFALAKGAETGNLLHDMLEHCEFTKPDFSNLWQRIERRYSSLAKTMEKAALAAWLTEILASPIGDITLGCLDSNCTLREAEFYFPMGGADIAELGRFISRRRGASYQLPERHRLKGMMHGYIDLVYESNGKYFVVDYKSTHLGNDFGDYIQEKLATQNREHSYDLQYTLYALALHRYLQSRLANYDPDLHFGGVYYLYVRGMHPDHQSGVFFDKLTSQELATLNDLFAQSDDNSVRKAE